MKVWVVTGDAHIEDRYGAEIEIFGVYDNKKKALERIKAIEEKGLVAYARISEISLNKSIEEYVGGYEE